MLVGVYLSGLQIVTRPLTTADIHSLLASCTETLGTVIISADSFLESSNIGIDIITPAVCDGTINVYTPVLLCFPNSDNHILLSENSE